MTAGHVSSDGTDEFDLTLSPLCFLLAVSSPEVRKADLWQSNKN